jgi:hypothetical protein
MSADAEMPDIALRLYGEARATAPERQVAVGGLSFTVDGMSLRWISWRGIEVLRGVAFVARDRDWGTYVPHIQIERHEVTESHAHIVVLADIGADGTRLACRMTIESTEVALTVTAEAAAGGDFETNRIGFVILHPASCAGQEVQVEYTNGTTTRGRVPKLISPHQPFFDVRAIEHYPASGVTVATRFEGDVFEMEDQRNWSDASFKTYSRPLALPFPYMIRSGETVRQTVQLGVAGVVPTDVRRADSLVRVRIGDPAGVRLPRLGIGGRPQDYVGSDVARARLAALRPSVLLVELNAPGADAEHLGAVGAAQAATGAGLVPMVRRGHGELAALAQSGLVSSALALVGADAALIDEARRVFPNAPVGTGTDAFFAEFNRKPPIAADFVFWTVNPTVHAVDDASVMETLAVLADQADTARAHCPDVPLWCGPVTLRMRFNPNATGPAAREVPGIPPADVDSRQRGLFGATFTLGQIAAWAAAGIDTLVLYAPFGPRGVVHARAAFPMPWYDDQSDGAVYPAYHVLAGLTRYAGSEMRMVETTSPHLISALAVGDSLWLANLGPAAVTVTTPGAQARLLDAESFVEAVRQPEGFWNRGVERIAEGTVRLGAYAIARIKV